MGACLWNVLDAHAVACTAHFQLTHKRSGALQTLGAWSNNWHATSNATHCWLLSLPQRDIAIASAQPAGGSSSSQISSSHKLSLTHWMLSSDSDTGCWSYCTYVQLWVFIVSVHLGTTALHWQEPCPSHLYFWWQPGPLPELCKKQHWRIQLCPLSNKNDTHTHPEVPGTHNTATCCSCLTFQTSHLARFDVAVHDNLPQRRVLLASETTTRFQPRSKCLWAGRQAGLLHKAECFAAMHIGGAALPTMRSFTGLTRVIDGFIIICYRVVFKKAATRVQNGFCVKGCLLYLSISTNISEYLGSYPVWCHNVTLLACVNLFAVQ